MKKKLNRFCKSISLLGLDVESFVQLVSGVEGDEI